MVEVSPQKYFPTVVIFSDSEEQGEIVLMMHWDGLCWKIVKKKLEDKIFTRP